MITYEQWTHIVSYVLTRLSEVSSFVVDQDGFAQKFKLDGDFQLHLLLRRDSPSPKLFELKLLSQSDIHPSGALQFSRLQGNLPTSVI